MNLQRTAGILMIIGFLLVIAAYVFGPPGFFQMADKNAQLALIASFQSA